MSRLRYSPEKFDTKSTGISEGKVDRPERLHPFLAKQLIAYIGNKRRLLPLIQRAISACGASSEESEKPLFVDFFSGSGSVSRLAKYCGFSIISNDWEYYASILNSAFLETNASDLKKMFRRYGGIASVLELLNSLEIGSDRDRYISKYYAPEYTEVADPDRERLFYTKKNAEQIDAIRAWIEREYPEPLLKGVRKKERNLLLGLLLYEAATHANTSGVFKAYHRGFGGRGKDALGRIFKKIELEYPQLIDGEAEVTSLDAIELAKKLRKEESRVAIAYLDPPYNQHQYGSNYHLLNTIARNDRPPIGKEICLNGKKVAKGGIRKDWTKTRSDYCYKKSAAISFRQLINTIQADRLLVSYSTEGIIPFREMLEILGEKGRLDIVVSEYTRYRGGKQALSTTLSNVEFVLIVDTAQKNSSSDIENIYQILNQENMKLLLKRAVSPAVFVREGFRVSGFSVLSKNLVFDKQLQNGCLLRVCVQDFKRIERCELIEDDRSVPVLETSASLQKECLSVLNRVTAVSREEELAVTLNSLRYLLEKGDHSAAESILPDIPILLKKFNDHKAYRRSLEFLDRSIRIMRSCSGYRELRQGRRFRNVLTQLGKVLEKKLSVPGGEEMQGLPSITSGIRESFSQLCTSAVFE